MKKAAKLSTDPYKGVRDFYPEDMFVQNYIFEQMRKTAESFGYVEYSASILEPADIYKAKTGEEIIGEQTYTFIDRGKREVTLRPEMTPTLARMVAARRRELAFPLRWYSIPNNFRYEQPQRGRLREHWQLNCDILGAAGAEAEAEIVTLAHRVMINLGASKKDFEIRVNSRNSLREMYAPILRDGVSDEQLFGLIDKMSKSLATEKDKEKIFKESLKDSPTKASRGLSAAMSILESRGIKVVHDKELVRGQDYYTDFVFEIFDTNPTNRRSLFGGGRYDNLLEIFGVEPIPAVGFGMGDVTIRDFLQTHGLLPSYRPTTDLMICRIDSKKGEKIEKIAENWRAGGVRVAVDISEKKIGDQIKNADKSLIPFIVCIGEEELKSGKFKLKNLKVGEETNLSAEEVPEFLAKYNNSKK